MNEALLDVRSLSAGYGSLQVLHDVSLRVGTGKSVALIGSNGAGKSTLVKAINGMLAPASGEILLGGRSVTRQPAYARVRDGIATVAEGRKLFPEMSVNDNLLCGALHERASKDRDRRRRELYDLFPKLRERSGQLVGSLSGGEQQMVAIARALMTKPRLLILDEPSIGLAPRVVKEIFQVLSRLSRSGLSVLLVEQNVQLSLSFVDYAYVVQQGRIALQGTPAELDGNEGVRKAYLGH